MAPDISWTTGTFLFYIVGGLFAAPFFIPVLTSAVTAWVLQLGSGALLCGVLFGVATVPLSWVFLQLGGWALWSVALMIGATLTALLLWWRSRARHSA